MSPAQETERLFLRMSSGDPEARRQVLEHFYDPLHRIARMLLRREGSACSLESGDLVHLALLLKMNQTPSRNLTPKTFLAFAWNGMRQIVIDRGRHRAVTRRHSDPIDGPSVALSPEIAIAVRDALKKLRSLDPAAAQIVEMRDVERLSWSEVAAALGMPVRTASERRRWAIAWLRSRLS